MIGRRKRNPNVERERTAETTSEVLAQVSNLVTRLYENLEELNTRITSNGHGAKGTE